MASLSQTIASTKACTCQFRPEREIPFLVSLPEIFNGGYFGGLSSCRMATYTIKLGKALDFAAASGEKILDPTQANSARIRAYFEGENGPSYLLTIKTPRDKKDPLLRGEMDIPLTRREFEILKAHQTGRLVEERYKIGGVIGRAFSATAELDIVLGCGPTIDVDGLCNSDRLRIPCYGTVDIELPVPDKRTFGSAAPKDPAQLLLAGQHTFEILRGAIPLRGGESNERGVKELRRILSTRRMAMEGLSRKQADIIAQLLKDQDPTRDSGRYNWLPLGGLSFSNT